MKTSHKKNRPFDFKLIDLVEPYPVLYKRAVGLSTYDYMKAKMKVWKEISQKMEIDVQFCISRWANLRNQFQKELRRNRQLCPRMGTVRSSTWPYLDRLKFLESSDQEKTNRSKDERRNSSDCCMRKGESISGDEYVNGVEYIDDELIESSYDELIESSYDEHEQLEPTFDEQESLESTLDGKGDIAENIPVASHLPKMLALLNSLDDTNRKRAECRIMAFLCKCQLRALLNQDVEDLVI